MRYNIQQKLEYLRFNSKMRVLFISTPCPVLLDGENIISPNRTNCFPITPIVLASNLKRQFEINDIPWEIIFKDFRSLELEENLWDKLIGYGAVKYGDRRLEKCYIGSIRAIGEELGKNDIVCITSNFSFESNIIIEILKLLKDKVYLLIVGGIDASTRYAFYLNNGADIISLGKSELFFSEFLCGLYKGMVPSYIYNKGLLNSSKATDLNKTVSLNFTFVEDYLHRYVESGGGSYFGSISFLPSVYYQTSRGCARDCSFCTSRLTKRSEVSLGKFLQDTKNLLVNGIKKIQISDENLLQRLRKGNKGRKELLEMFFWLKSRGFIWDFPAGLEVGSFLNSTQKEGIDIELLNSVFANNDNINNFEGAFRLLFPLENLLGGDDKFILGKVKVYYSTLRILEQIITRGIPHINLGVMLGWPTDTEHVMDRVKKRLANIYRLARVAGDKHGRAIKTHLNVSVFCVTPIPGTPFFEQMRREKRFKYDIEKDPELWNHYTSVIKGDNFSPEEVTHERNMILEMFDSVQSNGKIKKIEYSSQDDKK